MKILFLCTGNSARSQMAEGWARHYGDPAVGFVSAGTVPAREVHPLAIAAMAEKGVDISGHAPKRYSDLGPVEVTIAVCGEAAKECPTPPPGSEVEAWNLPDPAANPRLEVFRESRDEIERRVLDLLERRGLGG
jgi:arsenate reductase